MRLSRTLRPLGVLALFATAACVQPDASRARGTLPAMAWDHVPQSSGWTQAALTSLADDGAVLAATVPADVSHYCPTYAKEKPEERRAFWAGLFSALAKYESTWSPRATGGGGRYLGLLQISPATARYVGCTGDLHNGEDNLACAVKIAANQADPGDSVWEITRDWGPMHHADKRASVAAFTRAQAYCN
jgi:hypothetical protein